MTRIWIIDDQLTTLEVEALLGTDHEVLEVTTPDDDAFEDALAKDWDLILVDEELWPDGHQRPPQPIDGSSLVAAIRAWGRRERRQLPGIVILTNKATVFAEEVPAVGAWRPISESFVEHEAELGRTLDVEWLLTKQDENLKEKVADLATALVNAREAFGNGGISFAELKTYLGLPEQGPWTSLAEGALRQARPPVTEDQPNGATPQRGAVTVFIWLLQRVLAFPGLFVSDLQAAAFLGLKPASLDQAAGNSPSLKDCIYSGPLSTLVHRRWWAPGLDDFVARAEIDGTTILDAVGLGAEDDLAVRDPVVAVDRALREVAIVPIGEAVRVNLQGWPAEAMQPWMRRADLQGAPHWVQELVEPQDRPEPAA